MKTHVGLAHFLLRQPLAAPHLADLVALVVPAGGAISAVVLLRTTRALSAAFPLLFVPLLVQILAGRVAGLAGMAGLG